MNHADVAIAGAGLIGLATALELTAMGRRVTVFDRDEAMSEASRAAAGMLAGADPENPPELRDLARLSLRLYPDFLTKVETLSGKKIPIRTTITVQGVRRLPAGAKALSDSEFQRLAPRAETNGWTFCFLEEQSMDPWDLAEALPSAARSAGVEIREHSPVLRVVSHSHGVTVETDAGPFSAATFVNAAGAWSPSLDAAIPVAPRKGHMLTAELPGTIQMRCVLRTPSVYIVPRGGGRYTVGPTLEDAGFDKEVYPDHIRALFDKAVELWPPLRDANVCETWTGLRPGSADGLPVIDSAGPNCWVATGHLRNGIMLGPGTARVLAECISGAQPEISLAPFSLGRFATAALFV